MRFYPTNNLYSYYKKYSQDTWLSPRVHDHTNKHTLELMNRAINCCEHWATFLDVGAGSGRYSVALSYKFTKGYAVEVDTNKDLMEVRKKYKNISVIQKYIQDVHLKEKIDFILLADVFEHIPLSDISKFLKSLSSMQRKGGVIYLMTPNAVVCGPAEMSGIHHTRHPFGHHKHYTSRELDVIFTEFGYSRVFLRYEEASLRLIAKMPMLFVSTWDKRFHIPFIQLVDILFSCIGFFVTQHERAFENDELATRTICAAYKKI